MAKKRMGAVVVKASFPAAEREWTPFREVPRPNHPGLVSLFSNGEYIVQKWHGHPDLDHEWRLVIKRKDGQPVHDWMVLQRIKNEMVGPERVAVEVFPKQSELVDTGNLYHLWVMYEGIEVLWKLHPPLEADDPGV